uniref:Uncharacterized protein n=1 Tax=Fagus sylvatica TaxID=28930 RepID=A0A2N9EZZ6_FAGSY
MKSVKDLVTALSRSHGGTKWKWCYEVLAMVTMAVERENQEAPPPPDRWDRHSKVVRASRRGGPCFAAWWSVLHGVVVRASRRGLGGYRSEKRATPWVSPWWWLASVGPDLRKDPWVSPGGGWWFLVGQHPRRFELRSTTMP